LTSGRSPARRQIDVASPFASLQRVLAELWIRWIRVAE
jgi:hypothetical protein